MVPTLFQIKYSWTFQGPFKDFSTFFKELLLRIVKKWFADYTNKFRPEGMKNGNFFKDPWEPCHPLPPQITDHRLNIAPINRFFIVGRGVVGRGVVGRGSWVKGLWVEGCYEGNPFQRYQFEN